MKHDPRLHLDGHVVVWLASLAEWQNSLGALEPLLDARERERAARYRFAEDRVRFVMGRGLLRTMAGPYLMRESAIAIGYTDRDRPVFAAERKTQFSIAHSGDIVAVALTAHGQVGIDVEFMRADLDALELAPRIFSEAALGLFRALPAVEQRPAFFRAWTRKEAYLKARGEGIADALRDVDVRSDATEFSMIHDARDTTVEQTWYLRVLPLGPEYAGCVAFETVTKQGDVFWVRAASAGFELQRDDAASW